MRFLPVLGPVLFWVVPAIRAGGPPLHEPFRLGTADGTIIDHGEAMGHCGPWVEDIDGDGRKDLVVGDFSGQFTLYVNLGTNVAPRYAAGKKLEAGGKIAKVNVY